MSIRKEAAWSSPRCPLRGPSSDPLREAKRDAQSQGERDEAPGVGRSVVGLADIRREPSEDPLRREAGRFLDRPIDATEQALPGADVVGVVFGTAVDLEHRRPSLPVDPGGVVAIEGVQERRVDRLLEIAAALADALPLDLKRS